MGVWRKGGYADILAIDRQRRYFPDTNAMDVFLEHYADRFDVGKRDIMCRDFRLAVGTRAERFFPKEVAGWHVSVHSSGMKLLSGAAQNSHRSLTYTLDRPLQRVHREMFQYVWNSVAYMMATTRSEYVYRTLVRDTGNVIMLDRYSSRPLLREVATVWAAATCVNPLVSREMTQERLGQYPDMLEAVVRFNDVGERVNMQVGDMVARRMDESMWEHALFTSGASELGSHPSCPQHLSDITDVAS